MLQEYETGLNNLEKLAPSSEQAKVKVVATRLRENLAEEILFGASEQSRSDRSRIIYSLNKLAIELTHCSFDDLCRKQMSRQKRQLSGGKVALSPSLDSQVVDILQAYFNMGELNDLAFFLDIDFEDLGSNTKSGKARELVIYARRHGLAERLIAAIREKRPFIRHLLG